MLPVRRDPSPGSVKREGSAELSSQPAQHRNGGKNRRRGRQIASNTRVLTHLVPSQQVTEKKEGLGGRTLLTLTREKWLGGEKGKGDEPLLPAHKFSRSERLPCT
eukprot:2938212-Rhodomonas_salina.2